MPYASKRLILFTPKTKPWTLLENSWDNVLFYPTAVRADLPEADYR